jgi:hypothetical protein
LCLKKNTDCCCALAGSKAKAVGAIVKKAAARTSPDRTFPLILSFMLWFLKPFLAQHYAANPKMRTKGPKGRIQ